MSRIRAPRSASECRLAVSREISFGGREVKIRRLFRLLKTFVDAENAVRIDARIAAQNEANRLKQEALALKAASHRLRFAKTEWGRQTLLRRLELLEAENRELKMLVAERGTDKGTLPEDREIAHA
jgi:hypothetical protein